MKNVMLALAGLSLVAGFASSEESTPIPVSPGEAAHFEEVADVCPTFSWAAGPGAKAQELVIYEVREVSRPGSSDLTEVLRVSLPGSASSWTPGAGECLAAGDRYAWSVGALADEGSEGAEWSDPILFRVAAAPRHADGEEAIQVVQEDVEVEVEPDATGESPDREAESDADDTTGLVPVPLLPLPIELTVAGGVMAGSFTGEGSTLTNLSPWFIAPGTASINITGSAGSAGSVSCTGCIGSSQIATAGVTSSEIADGAVTSSDIADGAVTSSDIADQTIVAADLAPGVLPCSQASRAGALLDDEEPNGTTSPTYLCGEGTGAIWPIGDIDYWVNSAAVGNLVFAYVATGFVGAHSATFSVNSVLRVFASDGSLIDQDDNDGAQAFGFGSAVAGAVVPRGPIVYFEVRDWQDFPPTLPGDQIMYPYHLFAVVASTGDAQGEVEPNDAFFQARHIGRTIITGAVPGPDIDWWRFFARAGDVIVVICDDDPDKNGNITDTNIRVRDPDGVTDIAVGQNIATSDANTAGPVQAVNTGLHYLLVYNQGLPGLDTNYRCVVRVHPD